MTGAGGAWTGAGVALTGLVLLGMGECCCFDWAVVLFQVGGLGALRLAGWGGFFDWGRQQSIVDPEGRYTSATEADRVLYTLFLH